MTQAKNLEKPVELADDVTAELQAGHEYAAAFYAAGRRSLVASFDVKEVAKWDGSSEKALVSDPDGIDLPDQVERGKAA